MERVNVVLQARFAIIHGPGQHMDKANLGLIMKACVILHNIIVGNLHLDVLSFGIII